ncbi:MAG: MFS transporter [Asgard group archaeon]|nr:MFS transporter [Asgard group archaeon]
MTNPERHIDTIDLVTSEISIGDEDITIDRKDEVALYSRSIAFSTSNGLIYPFVSIISLKLGASASILAWIQAVNNFLRQLLEPLFGRLTDFTKRRIPFIVISTITWIIPYAFLYLVKAPEFIIVIVACVSILNSLGNPAWYALQNEIFPKEVRGKFSSRVAWFGSFGSMLATLFTGIILTIAFGDIDYQKYILIPVAVGVFISIIAVLPFRKVKEPHQRPELKIELTSRNVKESLKEVFSNKPFRKFAILYSIFGLFWTFSWPLFSIKQVNILGATAVEIALLEIIFAVTTLIFILIGGKLSDKIGRVRMIFMNRFILFLFPLLYIFATKIWHLYLVHFFISSFFSFSFAGVNAYILDIIPPKESGLYFGFLSLVTGIFYFIGTLSGGYMVEILQRWYSENTALIIALAFVSGARFLLSFLFLSLKEVKDFPTTFKLMIKSLNIRKQK